MRVHPRFSPRRPLFALQAREYGFLGLSAPVLWSGATPYQALGAKRRPRRVRWEGAANDFSGVREAPGHELVYVVVVAVLDIGVDAGVDAAGPRRPQVVANPALPEGGNARRGGPVRGIASVQSVREIGVLDLDRVAAGGYAREDVPGPADGGSEASSSILHSTYATLLVSISQLLMGRAS